ncbi:MULTISPECIES: MarR family winged helix-turn-helix transcriptional regulator [Paraburkholderia]|uniref:MarR family winged helix-turn-helix transcriptional regulator n=1 Tax=Paraburkholderia TaxID=1822464 RepID=UPI00224F7BF2|nr:MULTISPECIES: MarR family transcriptional regulator [Paraburkholderia]MCX4171751.1 MarR family transcriptional regulator [Paraburkholderia madseniana]MDQ6459760.1 MarR family transcriptional regulator [Paraburkholderia madseniana]
MSQTATKRAMSARTRKKSVSIQAEPAVHPHSPGSSHVDFITLQWQREYRNLDLSNFLLAIYFMRLGTLVELAFDKMTQELWGVSGSDMRVLLALRRSGHPYAKRPTDLYRSLLVTSGAITKKIDRLASLGLVERQSDPSHGGGSIVHLTRKGLDVVEKAIVKLAEESSIAPAMAHFTEAERASGTEFCLRTLALLEELNAPAIEDTEKIAPKSRTKAARQPSRNSR